MRVGPLVLVTRVCTVGLYGPHLVVLSECWNGAIAPLQRVKRVRDQIVTPKVP